MCIFLSFLSRSRVTWIATFLIKSKTKQDVPLYAFQLIHPTPFSAFTKPVAIPAAAQPPALISTVTNNEYVLQGPYFACVVLSNRTL
jgi:hypothetical protein